MKDMDINMLKSLDKEDKNLFEEFYHNVGEGKTSTKEILGLELPKARVYVPRACPGCQYGTTSLFSLMPLYDTVIFPIHAIAQKEKIIDPKVFKLVHSCYPEEVSLAAKEGHVLPYLVGPFENFDPELIKPILQSGVPRISDSQLELVKRIGMCRSFEGDCKKCTEESNRLIAGFSKVKDEGCLSCLRILSGYGLLKGLEPKKVKPKACNVMDLMISRNLDAVFQTDCPMAKDSFALLSGLQESKTVNYVLEGLGITWTNDIPLQRYLEVLDSKTTRAVREIVTRLMQDPYGRKYSHILNSKVFEVNQEIRSLGEGKAAKFYETISDMAVYGGSKFVEQQSQGYANPPRKSLKRIAEWVASKALDVHAKVTGKDWTIAQMYRLKCRLNSCKTE